MGQEIKRCITEEGKANPSDAVSCAHSHLSGDKAPSYNEAQVKAAEMECKKHITDSHNIVMCMSAVLPHIDAEGNYQ